MRIALASIIASGVVAATVAPASAQHVGNVSPIIYLERCKGGCTVTKGVDDARAYTSSIPDDPGQYTLGEWKNSQGLVGEAADAEWAMLVQCVKEVYSPFAAEVTDVKPTSPTYHMNIVAGLPADVQQPNYVGGVSPGVGCTPVDNRITYTFANSYRSTNVQYRTWTLCQVVAQETAHTYGLDHSFAFGARSACNDPMTYRNDCGGQRFFRNEQATCGETGPMPCACGATQNAHMALLNVFGPGTDLTTPPTLTVKNPTSGATIMNNYEVLATAHAQRGIHAMELWINGYMWKSIAGAQWGVNGQPEVDYGIRIPAEVPDGVMDIVVKAKDDIGKTTESPVITVTKGAPCASADSCLEGQKCDAGKCYWDPPTGELGDDCEYPQFCVTGMSCSGKSVDDTICTRTCVLGVDSCDAGYECVESSDNAPICWPKGKGGDDGICSSSVTTSSGAPLSLAMTMFGLLLVVGRRRRTRR